MPEKVFGESCNLHILPCPWCTQAMTPASREDCDAGACVVVPSKHSAHRSVPACPRPARCPPPCRPHSAASRGHSYLFLLSISLDISKASLQKPLTLPCLGFPSLPFFQPWFPNFCFSWSPTRVIRNSHLFDSNSQGPERIEYCVGNSRLQCGHGCFLTDSLSSILIEAPNTLRVTI